MTIRGATVISGRRATSWLAAGLGLAGIVAWVSAASASDWTRYSNGRFGASAEVPAIGFVAEPPPENGDGRGWKSADGKGEISIYGSFAASADNFEDYHRQALDYARADGVAVSYQAGKRNQWFVYSGTIGDDIVYMKAIRAEPCPHLVVNHIFFRYPADQRDRYAPIVTHGAKSLTTAPAIECE